MDLGAYLRSKLDDFKNTVSQTASNIESGIGSFAQDQYNRVTQNPNFVSTNDFFIKPFVNTINQGAQAGLRLATEHPYVASALQLGPIAKVGQIARKTNPTFNNSFNNYGAQAQLGDLGKMAGMAGALFAPEVGVGSGAFQAGTSALGNYFTGNGANNTYQNLLGQYNQGFDFGSKLGPIGAAVERIPGINTLAPKITAKLPFKAGANLLGNIGQSVAKEALTGGIYGGLNNEGVLQSAGGFAPFGLAGPLAGGALKGVAKGLKASMLENNPALANLARAMHPNDINVMDRSIDVLRNKKTEGIPAAEAEHYIRVLAEHYLPKGKADIAKDNPLKLGRMLQKFAGETMGDSSYVPGLGISVKSQKGPLFDTSGNIVDQLNPVQNATRITAQNGKIKAKLPQEMLRDLQKTARPNESVMQQDVRLLKNLGVSNFAKEMDALSTSTSFINPKNPKIKVPKQEPRGYTQEDTQRVAGIAQVNAEENFKDFLKLHDKWIGQRDVAKTSGYEVGAKFKDIPKESGPDVIKFIENPTSQAPKEIRQYADDLRKSYDELYNSAQKAGIDMGYLKDYITHIWDRPSGEVAQLYKAAKQRFNFANERVLPTYEEGIKLGLKPKFSTPQQIIAEYARKLEETKANVDFFNTARKEGYVVDATIGSREPGFSPLVGPGFPKSSSLAPDGTRIQGYYYAPTKIADQINRIFSPQDYGKLGAAVNLGKKASATIQDVTLSGGLPGTALNAFTIAQAQKEALSGRIVSPLTSLFRSVSPKMSEDYFNRNIDTIKKMQANNIPLSTTLNVEDLVGGLNANGVGGKLKQLWNKSVNDPTFKRFMPMLQINLFKDIENQALKGGVSSEEATQVATQAVKNFYGVTGSGETARRNKFAGDVAGTFLFAPKFRESMINFWVNSVKALKNPLALENRANVKFLAGATLTYAAMNAIQKQTTGKYLWENPDDKKDKMLIPLNNGSDIVLGVPFLSSIATVPRNIAAAGIKVAHGDLKGAFVDSARAFGSTTAKLPAELIGNQDYFGNQIYNENDTPLDKYKKMGAYTIKSLNHPYVKAAMDIANSGKSGPQIASETLELPLRFYKQKSIDSSYYFDAVKKSLETLDQTELSAYKALPSSKLFEAGDPQKAIVNANILLAYPKVFDAKRQAQIQTANGDTSKIDPLYLADDATVKKYLRYQTLPPGSSDKKDMYAANPEIGHLAKARSEYFTANPLPNGNTSNKPMPSDYVQKQMDAKNWADPQVKAYLDANSAYNNDQRAKLGLPPLAGFASFPKKASTGRKVGKVKVGKVKKPKIKLTKVKVKNIKASKVTALKVPKYKPLKIA